MNVYRKDTISGAYRLSSQPNVLKKVKAEESPKKPSLREGDPGIFDSTAKQAARAHTLCIQTGAENSPTFVKDRNSSYVIIENEDKNQLALPTHVLENNNLENLEILKKQLTPVTDVKSHQQMSFIGETARHDDITDSPKTNDNLKSLNDHLKSATGKDSLVPRKRMQDAHTSTGPRGNVHLTEREEATRQSPTSQQLQQQQ